MPSTFPVAARCTMASPAEYRQMEWYLMMKLFFAGRSRCVLLALLTTLFTALSPEVFADVPLLPAPKEMKMLEGTFPVSDQTPIVFASEVDEPVRLAASAMVYWMEATWGVSPSATNEGDAPAIILQVPDNPVTEGPAADGYTLRISPEEIRVVGNSMTGLYYGVITLTQIAQAQDEAALPALEIRDEPDFAFRGFYHDVTRGKVPTLDTLKRIADFLADHKANQMQLYVEHTFAFSFDPRIAQNPDGLTAEEIRELDAYCAARNIDLVPSLQSFGHMAGVLSIPEYRMFAEVELEREWDDLTWHERMKGATLDTKNPEARALLKRMLDEYLPLFDSKYVNVCADETYDVGKGKNKEYAEEVGVGELYLEHINWLNEVCKSHGKRMMFWGDIVKKHPDLIPEIPKDTILLNWGYHHSTDYESSKLFQEAGLDFYVCPGTSGWNEILNRIDNADLNIRRYVEAGEEYGAMGVLNTDWGDHGHYNLLAGSWHGAALGASMAWNSGTPDSEEFDSRLSARMFDDPSGEPFRALRELSFDLETYSSWRCFYAPMADVDALKRISEDEAAALFENGPEVAAMFEGFLRNGQGNPQDLREFAHMARMMGMLGRKTQLARAVDAAGEEPDAELSAALETFAADLTELYAEYERLWRARNKESELHEIREKIEDLLAECRAISRRLEA